MDAGPDANLMQVILQNVWKFGVFLLGLVSSALGYAYKRRDGEIAKIQEEQTNRLNDLEERISQAPSKDDLAAHSDRVETSLKNLGDQQRDIQSRLDRLFEQLLTHLGKPKQE